MVLLKNITITVNYANNYVIKYPLEKLQLLILKTGRICNRPELRNTLEGILY